MAAGYRIFGSELSPYSVKVRSYFRYKGLPHTWVLRHAGNMDEFRRHARLPLIPLVLTPEGEALQDSTPIIEELERRHAEPPLEPGDPLLAFVSALIEEYADEWGNKPMFHFRWTYEADARSAADRIAAENLPQGSADERQRLAAAVRERMLPRLAFVGSSPQTRDSIEASFDRQLALLDTHLASRSYLFGERPALGDFGLFAQIYECSTDPTPAARLRERAPRVLAWLERMLEPRAGGDFESWEALAATLLPLLREEVAAVFLPWSDANARALAAGESRFEVALRGRPFAQDTQKYHARSLAKLREKYAAVRDRQKLASILDESGCERWLRA